MVEWKLVVLEGHLRLANKISKNLRMDEREKHREPHDTLCMNEWILKRLLFITGVRMKRG